MSDVVILYRAETAGFAYDGLIIYTDTDDGINQMPGSLSDMFHYAELSWGIKVSLGVWNSTP